MTSLPSAASGAELSSHSAPPTLVTEDAEKPEDDTSKLRLFLGILKKFIGVADIASVRFSLPSQLLEPTPNLEYWNYLDVPSTFVAMGEADNDVDRMLEVLRFWFTKDLKYVKGKPCKPYNSALGEFFRCNWDVDDHMPPIHSSKHAGSAASSLKSEKPGSSRTSPKLSLGKKSPDSTPPTTSPALKTTTEKVRVSYLTEQTSHHPPVSAFYVECPAKGIRACGFDQISAKFTGTSIRVTPGEHNLGIFITLQRHGDETYQLGHPAAHLGGLLRGSLSVTVSDTCYVKCPKTRIKTILHYVEEGWLGKTQNRLDGVVFRYDPENDTKMRIKDVDDKDILCRIGGNWKDKLWYGVGAKASPNTHTLIDLNPLSVASKTLPPLSSQLPNESLRLWSSVTEAIHARQFSRATTVKQDLEEEQREKQRVREASGVEWRPRYFEEATSADGRPVLSESGRRVLQSLQEGRWDVEGEEGASGG